MQCDANSVELGTPDVNCQVAALIWRRVSKDVEVLLVTSRTSGHWLLPKGWPLEGKSLVEAAMQEAFEEAGIRGYSDGIPVGTYSYRKLLSGGAALDCEVDVFAIEAIDVLDSWPERDQRRREWCTLGAAAERVMEPDLARFLAGCDDRFAVGYFRRLPRPEGERILPADPSVTCEKDKAVITSAQCRAGRALVDWSIEQLAAASCLPVEQLAEFERTGSMEKASNKLVARALTETGVGFLPERRGRGVGVRLKFGRQIAKRIDIWENEGGPAAEDFIL